MTRVQKRADQLGAETYQGPADVAQNRAWIKQKKAEGAEVHDVGPDFSRRQQREASGESGDGPFYNLERQETKDYDNYVKEFERTSRTEGGSDYVD